MNSRFVNTIIDSNLGKIELWNHIRNLRFEYLMTKIDSSCGGSDQFIPGQDIQNNIEKLSKINGIKSSDQIRKNVSENDLQVGAEMFVTIASCPSIYERLYWKAIYGPKSRIVFLASNIVKRANYDFKTKAIQLFEKISSVLGFQYISNDHMGNKNIVNVEGE